MEEDSGKKHITISRLSSDLFWGCHSPFASLCGAALIVLASARFAFALVCSGALIWVWGLSALVYRGAWGFMPIKGKPVVLLFLTAFFSGIYILLVDMLNPLLYFSTAFFLILIPPFCIGSRLFDDCEGVDPFEFFSRAMLEAMVYSFIMLAFALVREPLGMGVISFPGSAEGIMEVFNSAGFIPARLLSAVSGALILFAFAVAAYRSLKSRRENKSEEGL